MKKSGFGRSREEAIVRLLHHADITLWQFRLLDVISVAPIPNHSTSGLTRLFRLSETTDEDIQDVCRAFQRLLDQQLVQIIDDVVLQSICEEIARDGRDKYWGDLPLIGSADFTWKGAILWCGITEAAWSLKKYWTTWPREEKDGNKIEYDIIGTHPAMIDEAIRALEHDHPQHRITKVGGITCMGRWRRTWWRHFRDGFYAHVVCEPDSEHCSSWANEGE